MSNGDKQEASSPEAPAGRPRQQKGLLHFAAHNLRLRYDQIDRDISYMQEADRFYLQEEYSHYFNAIKGNIASPLASADQIKIDLADLPDHNFINHYQGLSDQLGEKAGFQEQWQAFRLAIEQRMVLKYRHFLNKIDIIIRDCFYAMRGIETLTGESLGLPPIAVLEVSSNFNIRPTGEALIPLITIPFDRMETPWNLCAIHHEVGHDLFHRLTCKNPDLSYLKKNVKTRMEQLAIQNASISVVSKCVDAIQQNGEDYYQFWLEELAADMFGVMLAGPVYVNSLQEILLKDDVFTDFDSRYPSTCFRIMFNIIFARDKLGYKTEANRLLYRWQKLFSQNDHVDKLKQAVKKEDDTFDVSPLSAVTILQWLSSLVEACWEAGIAPGINEKTGEVNLYKIYDQMRQAEYTERLAIKRRIYRAKRALVSLKNANCWPRYLVPALRLAYEERIMRNKVTEKGWEKRLSGCFLNSVAEPAHVTNFFAERTFRKT